MFPIPLITRWCSIPRACTDVGDDALYLRDSRRIESPRLLQADALVEIPQHTGFAGHCDELPCDDRATQLLIHRIGRRRNRVVCAADRMVMHELSIRLVAERLIPRGAQDQAVPGLVHRMRGHPDHLLVVQSCRAAAQPLAQTSLDEVAWLPRARLEHRGNQLEFCHRLTSTIESLVVSHVSHLPLAAATAAATATATAPAAAAASAGAHSAKAHPGAGLGGR